MHFCFLILWFVVVWVWCYLRVVCGKEKAVRVSRQKVSEVKADNQVNDKKKKNLIFLFRQPVLFRATTGKKNLPSSKIQIGTQLPFKLLILLLQNHSCTQTPSLHCLFIFSHLPHVFGSPPSLSLIFHFLLFDILHYTCIVSSDAEVQNV